ncbi:aminoglycoside phosphotransferase family protein [Modestobacter sp. Leaf380]|uniref:aminoglycoside phosphotransferase family protein n=1 Tax=Modestobacter sp. Leaf380 TaxID=1736356 RepID=UPI0006F87D3C|nr:aminoglycoside phosphotransferase family protein [Modestobacter sp. Leaf380]KQS65787.1 hypothetical protein ASG41_14485 [Modestobacter sp. Leaf380]
MVRTGPSGAQLRWVVATAAPEATVLAVVGLRDRSSPWRVSLSDGRDVVLRVGGDVGLLRAELAGLRAAGAAGLPAPRVLGSALDRTPALLLTLALPGTSVIPTVRDDARLAALGAAAARVAAVAPPPGLDRVDSPIGGVDFAALRTAFPRPLLTEAEAALAARGAHEGPLGFVHGDLWHGNTLWTPDGTLTGLLDWDCSGTGPVGLDLGSARLDAVLCHGPGAEEPVLAGWSAAGGPDVDVARWDLVAGLATPPTMDWFVDAIAGQGRPDLGAALLIERRDEFLRAAL